LGGGQNGEEKGSRRLPSVARRRDNAQRAPSDPATATLVAECRTPAATANDLSSRAPAVSDRAGSHDEENSRTLVERIVHRDQAVRIDDDFFRELLCIEGGMQRATLFVPTGPGDAAVKNAGEHGAWLRDLRERAGYKFRDDVGRALSLSRRDS